VDPSSEKLSHNPFAGHASLSGLVQPPGLDTYNYTLLLPSTPFDITIYIFLYIFDSLYPLHFNPPVPLLTLTRDVLGAWERSREFEPEIVQFLVTCNHVIWRARAASRLCRNSRIRRIILWTLGARLASCQTGFVLCIRSMSLFCYSSISYSAVTLFLLASIPRHLISSSLR
jgi:hypothetical protein